MPYIYHVSTDPRAIGSMSPDDFADCLGALSADYVIDADPKVAAEAVGRLKERLSAAGFAVKESETRAQTPEAAFSFETSADTDRKKDAWFKTDYDVLRRLVLDMTPKQFSCSTDYPYRIKEAADDAFGDLAYLDMGTGPALYTLPTFIRNLEPSRNFYVAPGVIYVH